MKKRIEWIDSLKGLGIFYVVFAHLSPNMALEKYIFSFHMFLFFTLSGFLHRKTMMPLAAYIVHKAKSLMIPFAFWNFCATIISLFVNEDTADVISRFFTINGEFCWNRPIWFLPALFFTDVIYQCLDKYLPRGKTIILLAMPFLWYALDGAKLFLKIDMVPIALVFYWVGTLLKKMTEHPEVLKKKQGIIAAVLPICAVTHIMFGVCLNGRISYTGSDFDNYFYCFLAGIAGVLFYIFLFWTIRPSKVLSALGKNTLFIVCSHYWILTVASAISKKFFDYDVWHARGTLKALVVSVSLLLITWGMLSVFLKLCRKIPWLKNTAVFLGISMNEKEIISAGR